MVNELDKKILRLKLTIAGHLSNIHEPLREILARKNVLTLLFVCFLVQASHGPYYTFYSIYLEDNGYKRDLIGGLWAVSVLAEIGIFLVMHRLMPKFGPRNLLLTALLLTTVRWLMIAGMKAINWGSLLHP